MRNKKLKIIFGILILLVIGLFLQYKLRQTKPDGEVIQEITPFVGTVQNVISTTGTVLPKNRLEIKPPVNGRIDEILIQEGEKVNTGQTLAWMSSTERAALLDAARGQSKETLEYWKEVYKAIPLISPIEGEVIVAKTQAGQTVTTADAVIVLSDQLIIRAQVDETDIGKIKLGQLAMVILDAYPDTKIKAKVEHIYYESETVNNVTIYKVDLVPEETPEFFRSGMNASIDFIERGKENILLIPVDTVYKENSETYCLVRQNNSKEPIKTRVTLGISDDKNIEVISGLNKNDAIIAKSKRYSLPKSNVGRNPFMPGH